MKSNSKLKHLLKWLDILAILALFVLGVIYILDITSQTSLVQTELILIMIPIFTFYVVVKRLVGGTIESGI